MNKTKVLVTGVTGFVGGHILKRFIADPNYSVVAVSRSSLRPFPSEEVASFIISDLSAANDWSAPLEGVDVVIHAAGRAHRPNSEVGHELAEDLRVNAEATLALAEQAAAAGVRRFVFISSIGVNGSSTSSAFKESDPPAPISSYACSKLEAEKALFELSSKSGLEVVVLRPPMVYGAGAPGNFSKLIRLVEIGLPLPFGAIRNRRSFVAVDNLVDLVAICTEHPAAANQVFLVSDGEDVSTTQLFRRLAKTMNKTQVLVPIPMSWIYFLCRILKRDAMAESLLGSLQVDISKARRVLGWMPPHTVAVGLQRCFTSRCKD